MSEPNWKERQGKRERRKRGFQFEDYYPIIRCRWPEQHKSKGYSVRDGVETCVECLEELQNLEAWNHAVKEDRDGKEKGQ